MKTLRSLLRINLAILGAVLIAACPDGTSPPAVASVQMTSTKTNPRVGETTNLTAKAVNEGGVEIQGVACVFTTGNAGVATVDATSGTVTALATGTAVITATCGGKFNTITITVLPRQFTLTVSKTGAGAGAVFNTPAGTTFDDGTVVSITATANNGSTFSGWGGACTGTTQPCAVTMSANQTVTADFALGENFILSLPMSKTMTSVVDGGCTYTVSVDLTSFNLTVGTTTATGTMNSNINITGNSGACQGNPFTVQSTGTLTVSGTSISGTLSHTGTNGVTDQTVTFSGTRNGTSISATVSVAEVLKNNAGASFNTNTTSAINITLSKTVP